LDDLFDAYYSGVIDYGTFSILYNAYNLGGLTEADLKALHISEDSDLDLLLAQPDTTAFWVELLTGYDGKIGVRRYSGNFDDIYGDYYIDLSAHSFSTNVAIRQEKGDYIFRRRSLSWENSNVMITAGNYLIESGYGLVIGRYDYRPSSGYTNDNDDNFLYPDNNYYNGLKVAARVSRFESKLYYSKKNYNDIDKLFYGVTGDFVLESFKGGLSYGINQLDDDNGNDDRQAAGLHARIETENYTLAGEYAVIEKAGGSYLLAERKFTNWLIQAEFWHYARSFNNYNCTGPSASDYETFYPIDDSPGFRSHQAGETGMALSYKNKAISSGIQLWNHVDDNELNSSLYLGYNQTITNKFKTYCQTSYRNVKDNHYFWLKTSLLTAIDPFKKLGVKFYFKNSDLINGDCYMFLNLAHDLNDKLGLSISLRNYFDGQLYYFIEEDFRPARGFIVKSEFSYKKTTRINIKIEKVL
jgi:hypothetical protein